MQGVLLDSDYLIALTFNNESTHHRASAIRANIAGIDQFILIPTLYELATVTSRKFGHDYSCNLIKLLETLPVKRLTVDNLRDDILNMFYSQRKKSTSMFDCANLVAAEHYGLKIASFDKFYPKTILINA